MAEMVYRWRANAEFAGTRHDAQRVAETLMTIAKDNGGTVAAQDVVAAARAIDSPLHPLFEWDDRKAAREYRLAQAAVLVTAVVQVIQDDGHAIPVFMRTSGATTRVYRVLEPPDPAPVFTRPVRTPGQQLTQAWREIKDWRRRYGHLDALAPIVNAIDETLQQRPGKTAT